MNWYNGERDAWKEIVAAVAAEEHRSLVMIEKDTIQSVILGRLAAGSLPIVFKGGTSLSKAYGLIDRFSEDIDLSAGRRLTESERRNIKSLIIDSCSDIGLVLSNADKIQSRHSYNRYVFEYESLFSDIRQEIVIETSFYQSVYPVEKHPVGSFIGKFCDERSVKLPVAFDEATVYMYVQSIERTFIDKVFAVCDYRLQNMQDRDSRHLYDIAKLLPVIQFTPELKELATSVRKDRMFSKNNPSAQPQYNIQNILKEIISSRFYESDYNSITKKLLYEDMSYVEAIESGIAIVAETDIFL